MPKYEKKKKRNQSKYDEEMKRVAELKKVMYSSSIKSLIIAGVCFIISLLFNGNIIPIETESGSPLDVLMIIIKSLLIISFFIFTMLGLANNMELKGNPSTIKETLIIAVMALLQSIRSGWVFGISLVGILLIVLYLWLMQAKVETA